MLCCLCSIIITYSLPSAGPNLAPGISVFTDLQQLWTEVKDGLAEKALAALRQSAGLPPPLGLLALPTELKLRILASLQVCIALFPLLAPSCLNALAPAVVLCWLQAKELAAAACCCRELRCTASSDTLWQPLFRQEFPSIDNYLSEHTQALRAGWKKLYCQSWQVRSVLFNPTSTRAVLHHMIPHTVCAKHTSCMRACTCVQTACSSL